MIRYFADFDIKFSVTKFSLGIRENATKNCRI